MKKHYCFVAILAFMSACGQQDRAQEAQQNHETSAVVSAERNAQASDEVAHRSTVDGRVVVLGKQVGNRWEYCYLYVGIINDQNYLESVASRAQTELARAEAEKNEKRTAAIESLTQEIRLELARLNDRLQTLAKSEAILREQISVLQKFESERRVDESYVAALRSVAKLLNVSVADLFSASVEAIDASELASGGSITIVTNENGEKVFRQGSGENTVSFAGGTLAAYLKTLAAHRLIVKSDKSIAPLKSAMSALQDAAQNRYESAAQKLSELRAQTDASIARLTKAIEAIKAVEVKP